MRKVSLFFLVAALLGAALILGGCDNPTNGAAGAAGAAGFGFVSGDVTIDGLQAVIDGAVEAGATIYLDSVDMSDYGTVDFKTAKATIIGDFTTKAGGTTIINAANATVKFNAGAKIAGQAGDVVIGDKKVFITATTVTGAAVAAPVADEDGFDGLGGVTAVKDLKLTADLDIPSTLKVYVYGTLTVGADTANPTDGYGTGIVAIGTVEVTATNATALSVATNVDVTKATILYEGNTTVAITLPATLSSPTFKVTNEQGVLQVLGTTSFSGYVTANNGVVEFGAAVTAATITGNGRIRFANGTTATGFATSASSIVGTRIEFPNGFSTAQNAPLTLGGEVYIGDGKTITLSTSDTTGTLTLKDGSTIYAEPTSGDPVLLVTANNVGSAVVLTPVAGAILTASATGKSLTLSAQNLTLTQGEIEVAADATLDVGAQTLTMGDGALVALGTVTVGGATGKVTLTKASIAGAGTLAGTGNNGTVTLAAGDELDIADGGTVALAGTGSVVLTTAASGKTGGAKLVGAGKLTAGATEIVGGKDGWLAVLDSGTAAETVTIASTATGGQATITGSTTATTASLEGGEGATITQKAGTASNSLNLATVTVDVSTAGSLILKSGTDPAKVAMGAATSIIKAGSDSSATVTNATITGLTISSVVVKAAAATPTDGPLGSLVGADSATLTVTADVTISKDTKVSGKT